MPLPPVPETSLDPRDPRYLAKAIVTTNTVGTLTAGSSYTTPTANELSQGIYLWWIRVGCTESDAKFKFRLTAENTDEGIPDEIPVNGPVPNVVSIDYVQYAVGDTGLIPIEGGLSRGTSFILHVEHLTTSPVGSAQFIVSIAMSLDFDDLADAALANTINNL